MQPGADLYLAGRLGVDGDGIELRRGGTADDERAAGPIVPLADPEGVVDPGLDGRWCTVGLDVSVVEASPADRESAGVRVGDDSVTLVGRRRSVPGRIDRPEFSLDDLVLDGGCWPIALRRRDRKFPTTVRPLEDHPDADAVGVEFEDPTVVEVLSGDRDPFHGPVGPPRFEVSTGGDLRLSVPEVPVWADHGWANSTPGPVLEWFGHRLLEATNDGTVGSTYPPDDRLDFDVTFDAGLIRVETVVSRQRLGVQPPDGVGFAFDDLAGAWIRDVRAYLDRFDDESLREVYEAVTDAVGVGPEAATPPSDPRPLAGSVDPDSHSTADLVTVAREEPLDRRDAVRALADRGATAAVDDLAAIVERGGLPAADRYATLAALGELDAEAPLVRVLQGDRMPRLRRLAAALAGETCGPDRVETLVQAAIAEPVGIVRHAIAGSVEAIDPEAATDHHLGQLAGVDDESDRRKFHDLVAGPGPPRRTTVVDGLTDDRPEIRLVALTAAGRLQSNPPFEQVGTLLAAEDPAVRRRAAETIRTLTERSTATPPVGSLLEGLTAAPGVRYPTLDAVETLSRRYDGGQFFGTDPGRVLATLAAIAEDSDSRADQVARTIARIVRELGAEAAPDAFPTDPDDRAALARALGRLDEPAAGDEVFAVLAALAGDDDAVSTAATESLAAVLAGRSLSDVGLDPHRLLADAPDLAEVVGDDAVVEGDLDAADASVEGLLVATNDDDWTRRVRAVEALSTSLDDDRVRDRLATLVREDPDDSVRRVALEAIAGVGDDRARATVLSVLDADDQPAHLRRVACRHLERRAELGADAEIAVRLAGRFPEAPAEYWPELVRALDAHAAAVEDDDVARRIGRALRNRAAAGETTAVRRVAVESIPAFAGPLPASLDEAATVETLSNVLAEDPAPPVRAAAVTVLARIGTDEALAAVEEASSGGR